MIKKFFDMYGIEKNGLIIGQDKQCICGNKTTADTCENCGNVLKKSKMLNAAKSTPLAKREETIITDDIIEYKIISLFSNNFNLYEQMTFCFSVDKKKEEIKISSLPTFKKQKRTGDFCTFIDKTMPGFIDMIQEAIDSMPCPQFSSFAGLSEEYLGNMLHVYLNYRAVFPYLLKYKAIYFGKHLNLKNYFPETDFNDSDSINKTPVNWNLLKFWDIKNVKYFDSIIDISKEIEQKERLQEMIEESLKEGRHLLTSYYGIDENDIINTFNMLFNKEISVKDFIRIFNRSTPNNFFKLKKYRTMYKKAYGKEVDFSTIKGITRKEYSTVKMRCALKQNKKSKSEIDDIFATLETSPLDALKKL